MLANLYLVIQVLKTSIKNAVDATTNPDKT